MGDVAEELAGAILDGRTVDWDAESEVGPDRLIVPYLREVARIVALYRNAGASRSSGSVAVEPFAWAILASENGSALVRLARSIGPGTRSSIATSP